MSSLPSQYSWLNKEPGPNILLQALKEYGTAEIVGIKHNPKILAWADEVGGWIAEFYTKDEIPWCGLFVGICAKRAGFPFTQKMLGAINWLSWGTPVAPGKEMLGDVLVFKRDGGGHVGIYVGEDADAFHVLGGNQGNKVSIARIGKYRFAGARRCTWNIAQPANVRKVYLKGDGGLSQNEA